MRLYILTTILLLKVFYANGQVVCNNNAENVAINDFTTSITLANYTVPSGENSLVVVISLTTAFANTTNIMYGGTPMILLDGILPGFGISMWYLPLGNLTSQMSNDIIANYGSISNSSQIFATSFQNVDQINPMSGFVDNFFQLEPTSSLTINCAPGDKAIDFITAQSLLSDPPRLTPGDNQTLETESVGGLNFAAFQSSSSVSGEIIAGNSVVMDWTISGNNSPSGYHIAAGIKSAGELPQAVIPTMSQWGLIILGLLLLNFSIVTVREREILLEDC